MPAYRTQVESMENRPARHRRRTASGALVSLVVLFALVGCSSSMRQPTSYGDVNTKGDGFYGNLMYGCTGVQPTNGKYVPKDGKELLSSESYCKCLFEGLKNKVPFDEVRDFEEAQANAKEGEPPSVPKGIEDVRRDCSKRNPA